MKITSQVLKNAAVGSLAKTKFIDLSGKRIGSIQCLEGCQRLQTLLLHSNAIDTITNLECCSELWNIDLSGNKIRTINGLSQFPFLGTLLLTANSLDWTELKKLSHTHILSLSLNGNPKLIKDRHYRKHVIDLLPHLWMLDGQLITAGERRRIQQFFITSASTSKPVRRKTNSHSSFLPSSRKNLTITGVFGQRTSSVMTRFPLQEIHNIELDRRRLLCLAEMMEEDMKIESEYRESKGQRSFIVPQLRKMIEHRNSEIEQSNMLLLLLVAMLLFNLAEDLLIVTFDTAKLTSIGGIKCQELITLPRFVVLRIASLLLSAATIDKESDKDGGLYPQLYQSLQFSIHSLHSKTHLLDNEDINLTHHSLSSTPSGVNTITNDTYSRSATPSSTTPSLPSSSSTFSLLFPTKSHTHLSSQLAENFCLLASEVVHLLCLVPLFFELLDFDQDVINMVSIATRNSNVLEDANHIKWTILNNGGNIWDVYHELASYLLQSTTANVFSKRKALPIKSLTPPTSIPQSSSQIFQPPKRHTHLPPPRSQSAGAVASFRRRQMTPLQPDLGDLVLCAPERLARIIALPEQNVAVLQLNSEIQGMSGPPDSYFYTDTRGLQWDRTQGYWTRDDLASDLSAGRLHPSPDSVRANNTPSPASIDFTRPTSQLSYISEDLHTIPSVEELSIDEGSTMELPMSKEEEDDNVDIPIAVNITSGRQSTTTQRTNTPENIMEGISDLVHTFNQDQTHDMSAVDNKHHTEEGRECSSLTYEQWVIDKHLSGSLTEGMDLSDLTVSIPKLSHPELWESKKSLPNSRYSSSGKKPHSCAKRVSTTPPLQAGSQGGSTSPSVNLSPFHESKPKLVQAWSAPRLSQQPKQTLASKTRTSNRDQLQSIPLSSSIDSQQFSSHDSIILYPHLSPTHSPAVPHNTPTHATVYNIHSRLAKTKYQFQPVKKTKRSNNGHPRKLGDLQNLSVLGAYAW